MSSTNSVFAKKKISIRIFFLCLALFFLQSQKADANIDKENLLRDKFQKVLLVIHYNHAHYKSIDFLRKIYSPIFPNIVFYGPTEYPEVNAVFTNKGFLFSRVVAHALKNFPGYQGYIFLQDDCFMNFWNYARLNNEKIWFSTNETNDFHLATLKHPITNWPWWENTEVGLKKARKAIQNLEKKEKKRLDKNHGKDHVVAQVCDMFYIPGRFATKTIHLSEIFKDVFCEIAIPTLLSCMEDIHYWERLQYIWTGDGEAALNLYDPASDWVHPLKFSQESYQQFVELAIEECFLKTTN